MTLEDILKTRKNQKTSWKQKVAGVTASILLPFSGFLASVDAIRASGQNHLPADINKDSIVNFQDLSLLADSWLETEDNKRVIPVYKCGLLYEPNAVYVLQNNMNTQGNCFELLDGVTFDLNNHALNGNGTGNGVIIGSDSTIRNGKIYNFETGVEVFGNNNNLSLITSNNNNCEGLIMWGDNNRLSLINANFNFYEGIWIPVKVGRNNQIVDSDLSFNWMSDLVGSVTTDVTSNSNSNFFMGCKYDTELGNLSRVWPYLAQVKDSSGNPTANAKVYAYDTKGNLGLLVRTGADGKTPKVWLTDYINTEGIKTNYAPYTITATKDNKSATHVYDPNGFNSEDGFTLK